MTMMTMTMMTMTMTTTTAMTAMTMKTSRADWTTQVCINATKPRLCVLSFLSVI